MTRRAVLIEDGGDVAVEGDDAILRLGSATARRKKKKAGQAG
jgi:hypothetical protein